VQSATESEIWSQPATWLRAAQFCDHLRGLLPPDGARLAVVGCGTSYYIAHAFASAREASGHGETDAFCASEMPLTRRYDGVLAISRSGTTSEVLQLLQQLNGCGANVVITGVPRSPVLAAVDRGLVLDFADEQSVVQTRFATSTLALLRSTLGVDVDTLAGDAERALETPLPDGHAQYEHFVFLGSGWTVGLAEEAALKAREIAGAWAEAYPAMEYRHGPISVAGPRTLVWALGSLPDDLVAEIEATGASVVRDDLDPLAQLIVIQRFAVIRAQAIGRDPDRPTHLRRSVIVP
jgi:fructoselysine-6-P-deglycase FrlB-like protein